MKGISAVNRNMHDYAGAEMNQSIRIVTQLTKQISNTSQQIYITRNLEYFHYFVSKMQERTPESCALELMLDQIESLIAGESNFFNEASTTIYSNTNTNQLFDIYHPISVDYMTYSTETRWSMVM
jgi:dGTP triphosphohydrolase